MNSKTEPSTFLTNMLLTVMRSLRSKASGATSSASPRRIGVFEARASLLNENVGVIDFFWPGMLLVEHKSVLNRLDFPEKNVRGK